MSHCTTYPEGGDTYEVEWDYALPDDEYGSGTPTLSLRLLSLKRNGQELPREERVRVWQTCLHKAVRIESQGLGKLVDSFDPPAPSPPAAPRRRRAPANRRKRPQRDAS